MPLQQVLPVGCERRVAACPATIGETAHQPQNTDQNIPVKLTGKSKRNTPIYYSRISNLQSAQQSIQFSYSQGRFCISSQLSLSNCNRKQQRTWYVAGRVEMNELLGVCCVAKIKSFQGSDISRNSHSQQRSLRTSMVIETWGTCEFQVPFPVQHRERTMSVVLPSPSLAPAPAPAVTLPPHRLCSPSCRQPVGSRQCHSQTPES